MIEELHHRDRCAIVGIGETDYSRNSGRSDLTLATEAALAAVADAGLRPDEIDGVVRCDMDTVYHHDLVESIGMPNVTYWAEVGPGGVERRSCGNRSGRARDSVEDLLRQPRRKRSGWQLRLQDGEAALRR